MRAMILSAGLGTRMQPLTNHRAKPALPVLGRPVIAWLLHFLRSQGIEEVAVNLHHRPDSIKQAISEHGPADLPVHYFYEEEPLGTGGGIASARAFLSQSDPFVVLAGDMLIDFDLRDLIRKHLERQALGTLLLLDDPVRKRQFGSIGLSSSGRVRRIADRLDLEQESSSGLFVGLRVFSPTLFEALPPDSGTGSFEDLTDWIGPILSRPDSPVYGEMLTPAELQWVPIGTPEEYLAANLDPPAAPYLSPTPLAAPGTRVLGTHGDLILGAGARLEENVQLRSCVVWENETVPANFQATEGVFTDGRFYPSATPSRS